MRETTVPTPLVLLGLDTIDLDSMLPWVDAGELPTIGSILERGSWATIGGPDLICEYGTGLTVLSGVSRARHGYYYFRQLKPGSYEFQRVAPSDFGAPPFWASIAGGDRRALIVDPPETLPVPDLPGHQLSNWASHHPFGPAATVPASLLDEADQLVGRPLRIDIDETELGGARDLHARLLERVDQKGRLCRHLLEDGDYDLVAVFFGETDVATHLFWPFRNGDGASASERDLADAIPSMYRAIDRELGEILERVPGANVLLLSLYGIQDEHATGPLLEPFCRQLGYQPVRRSLRPLTIARRVLPQSLRDRVSRLLPTSTQESLLTERTLHDTDWSKTTAFAIPSLYTGFLRVNLAGREPEGAVRPGAEYEAVLARLEDDLAQLVDPVTDRPAVRSVTRTVDLFGGGPPETLPDLFVEWEPGAHFVERLVHPRTELVHSKPEHSPGSQEKLTGFLAAAGPSIAARGRVGEVSALDVAPTCLALLGERPSPEMTGEPLADLLARAERTPG